jgi:hypothetical protein
MTGFAMQMIMNARVCYMNDTKCAEIIGNAQVCGRGETVAPNSDLFEDAESQYAHEET